jgi:hypothetical protein
LSQEDLDVEASLSYSETLSQNQKVQITTMKHTKQAFSFAFPRLEPIPQLLISLQLLGLSREYCPLLIMVTLSSLLVPDLNGDSSINKILSFGSW